MVKINVSSKEIAHLWVNQTQPYARANSQSFEDNTFYSYRAEIGAIRYTPSGKKVIILNDTRYSVTTSKHQSRLIFACNHIPYFLYDNTFVKEFNYTPKPSEVTPEWLYNYYIKKSERVEYSASRARLANKIYYLNQANYYLAEANNVNKTFELNLEVQDDHKFDTILNDLNIKYAEEKRVKEAKQKLRLEEEKKNSLDKLVAWLNGNRIGFPSIYNSEGIFLRIDPLDSTIVETSRGANFPKELCEFLYKLYQRCKRTNTKYTEAIKVGEYILKSISSEGITAGCHHIKPEEIERFATVLKLSKLETQEL